MPTINIFHTPENQPAVPRELIPALKAYVAKELSCKNITLNPEEVSVRLITVDGLGMLAPIELEITAHAFQERIDKQDDICLHVRAFMMEHIPNRDVRVWLLLPQLGHSWE